MNEDKSKIYNAMINQVGDLQQKNARLNERITSMIQEQNYQKQNSMRMIVASCALTATIGWGVAIVTAPLPEAKNECNVYKVSPKTVTSFVLKPPPSPIEHAVCPEVPKCEQTESSKLSVETTETVQPEKPVQKKHYRHRRQRAYWR